MRFQFAQSGQHSQALIELFLFNIGKLYSQVCASITSVVQCGLPVSTLISTESNPFQWAEGRFPPLNYPPVMVGRLDQLQTSQGCGLDQTVAGWLSVVSLCVS